MNAVVLAAGFGKRLRPLTERVPKALVPLFGVPVVDFALARLAALGDRLGTVAINLHHLPDPVVAHAQDGRRFGLSVHYSHERSEIRGTGGALQKLAPMLGGGPFLVLNGDVYFDLPPERLIREHEEHPAAAAVVGLAHHPARPDLALVALDPVAGRVLSIAGRPAPPPEDATRWIFAGTHLLTPEILRHLPPDGFACVVRDGYFPLMAAGAEIRGVPAPGDPWHDVGTMAGYLDAHFALFPRLPDVMGALPHWPCRAHGDGIFLHPAARVAAGASLRGPVLVDAGARIEAGADVGPDVVLGRGAAVKAGARLRRTVVWENAEVRGEVTDAVVTAEEGVLTRKEGA